MRYSVVTPARNEEGNLPRLAAALVAQALPPVEWIVVDDGSTDATPAILADLERAHPWIRRLCRPEGQSAGIEAGRRQARDLDGFRRGVDALSELYDVVIKVDADVSFEADFGAGMMAGFAADELLALASGTCYEQEGDAWVRRTKAGSTVWGATRAYRADCVDVLMALEPFMGWDGLDEIQIQLRGLRTQTFIDLPFRHHRPEGGRELSSLHQGEALGRASWYMGYRPTYLALRALYRARREPAALAMLYGYGAAALRRDRRHPDAAIRDELRSRQRLGVALRRGAPSS